MSELLSWLAILAAGLIVTIKITFYATVFSIALSTMLAVWGISPWWPLRAASALYADFFRSIPLLALLIFSYYGLGSVAVKFGISAFWLAVAAVTVSESAYLGEIYRGGLLAIPQAQWEAAKSLGLGWFSTVWLIVLPQAVAPGLPSTLNAVIACMKNSSLASLVAVSEVTLVATILISQTFEPMQVYLVLAALYLIMLVPLSLLARWLEARYGGRELAGEDVQDAGRAPSESGVTVRAGV